jgi:hypothetical protein
MDYGFSPAARLRVLQLDAALPRMPGQRLHRHVPQRSEIASARMIASLFFVAPWQLRAQRRRSRLSSRNNGLHSSLRAAGAAAAAPACLRVSRAIANTPADIEDDLTGQHDCGRDRTQGRPHHCLATSPSRCAARSVPRPRSGSPSPAPVEPGREARLDRQHRRRYISRPIGSGSARRASRNCKTSKIVSNIKAIVGG